MKRKVRINYIFHVEKVYNKTYLDRKNSVVGSRVFGGPYYSRGSDRKNSVKTSGTYSITLSFHQTCVAIRVDILLYSDVDPDPVGSTFIWIQIHGYKIKGKQSLTNKFMGFFLGNYIFQV